MDHHRVRMAETTRRLPFPLEALQPLFVATHLDGQNLDRHAITQKLMARAIDCAHPTLRDESFYLVLSVQHAPDHLLMVGAERLAVARAEGHRRVIACSAFPADFHSSERCRARLPAISCLRCRGKYKGKKRKKELRSLTSREPSQY